ncbi:MAG: 50S ribosomal protein L9 [Bacilli bacterium]|nr:50S ribosomal protein L9 [Bacilli bacterium]
MRVIFIKDLKGQGKIGDIKEVKDGYGQNFLIKKGYAVLATKKSLEKLETDKINEKLKDKELMQEANKLKEKLESLELAFQVKTGEQDKVFGSISSKQICDKLEQEGYQINKKDILIDNQIASLGSHIVKVNLYKDIKAELRIKLIK